MFKAVNKLQPLISDCGPLATWLSFSAIKLIALKSSDKINSDQVCILEPISFVAREADKNAWSNRAHNKFYSHIRKITAV
jgi:hypothetical protein